MREMPALHSEEPPDFIMCSLISDPMPSTKEVSKLSLILVESWPGIAQLQSSNRDVVSNVKGTLPNKLL